MNANQILRWTMRLMRLGQRVMRERQKQAARQNRATADAGRKERSEKDGRAGR